MKYLGPLFTFILMYLLTYAGSDKVFQRGLDIWNSFYLIGGYCFFYITIRQLIDIERHG